MTTTGMVAVWFGNVMATRVSPASSQYRTRMTWLPLMTNERYFVFVSGTGVHGTIGRMLLGFQSDR